MKAKWLPIFIGLLIVAGVFYLRAIPNPFVESVLKRIGLIDYDLRLNYIKMQPYSGEPPIAVIDIDERSIDQIGRWPWPRHKIAELIDRLQAQGVAVIAFDIVFSRDDLNAASYVVDTLKEQGYDNEALFFELEALRPRFDNDNVLAKKLESRDTVLGMFFYNQDVREQDNSGELGEPLLRLAPDVADRYVITKMNSYIGNLSKLYHPGQRVGFLTFVGSGDGIVRRVPIVLRYGDALYPSLALEAVRLYFFERSVTLQTVAINSDIIIDSLTFGNLKVPLEADGRMLIPYHGPAKTFPTISVVDVLSGKDFSDQLAGAIVFVGASAFTLNDLITTPMHKLSYPGVEVHANVAAAILEQKFLHYPAWSIGYEGASIVICGVLLALTLPFLGSFYLMLVSGLVLFSFVGFNTYMWIDYGTVLPEMLSIFAIIMISMFNLIYGFTVEGRQRRQIKEMFGQYVPSRYIDKILKTDQGTSLQGESREMTVLFADVRGFTHISECLGDATKIKVFLNELFTPLTEIIFDHDGTIDKYVGDMVIAFWGAPLEDESHAEHALTAALAMLVKVKELESVFQAQGIESVQISCGINMGVMNVGDMGSKYRRSYTVLGDAVNLASRIESLTKYYGVNCIVTDELQRKVDKYAYRYLDCVRVKGKETGVEIYEPLCLLDDLDDALQVTLTNEAAAIAAYKAQHWQEAREKFNALLSSHPGVAFYKLYIERILELQSKPPAEDWDGIYTWNTK